MYEFFRMTFPAPLAQEKGRYAQRSPSAIGVRLWQDAWDANEVTLVIRARAAACRTPQGAGGTGFPNIGSAGGQKYTVPS